MISIIFNKLVASIRKNFFIILGCILAPACLSFPVQHYISIGRYQHYGFAFFIFGMGYVLHTAWTWTHSFPWSRACSAYAGAFFVSVGLIFYSCPWLDPVMSVMTDDQVLFRKYLVRGYVTAALGLLMFWVVSVIDERRHLKSLADTKKLEVVLPNGQIETSEKPPVSFNG